MVTPSHLGLVSHIADSVIDSGSESVASAALQPPRGLASDAQALLLSRRRLAPLPVRSLMARGHTHPLGVRFTTLPFLSTRFSSL